MPNVAALLKQEMSRIARREANRQIAGLRRASAQYRRNIKDLRLQLTSLERQLRSVSRNRSDGAQEESAAPIRFVPKGLRSLRERLGLSIADFARLLDVSAQSIYNWEKKGTRPRAEQLKQIARLRTMGKRQVAELLEGKQAA